MIAGIKLTMDNCYLAVLGDTLETYSFVENREIVEHLSEAEVDVIAIDTAWERSQAVAQEEQELIDEGFSFIPAEMEPELVKRSEHLVNLLKRKGLDCDFIRFDPVITSEELAVHSENALESLGLDVSSIGSSGEFDAVLGAVTARFYQEEQFEDMGVVVPKSLEG